MKSFVVVLGTLTTALLLCRQGQATVVADWSFPSSGTATNPVYASSWIWASSVPTLGGSLLASIHNHGGGADIFTTVGSFNVLEFSYNGSHSADINGQTLTLSLTASTNFTFSGLSYYGSFSGASATTPLTELWTYSIAGGASGTLGTVTLTNNNLDAESLSAGITIQAGQTITFTALINGASGNNQMLDFADFNLDSSTSVPEPSTSALAAVCIGLLIRAVGQIYLRGRPDDRARPSSSTVLSKPRMSLPTPRVVEAAKSNQVRAEVPAQ